MAMKTDDPTMNTDTLWAKVQTRDASADGQFVYAVQTTGIFCRPSCPSRRPKPDNVVYFNTPEAADAAGYRACRRCRPQEVAAPDPAVHRVRQACALIRDALDADEARPPTLAGLAERLGGSPTHLQRSFTRIMGISPAAYGDALRLRRLRQELRETGDVTGAVYGAGYGAPSRVYERADGELGMTPASYARGGRGARIGYALADTPLGRLLVGATRRGVCFLSLGERDGDLVAALEAEYPLAEIAADAVVLGEWLDTVVRYLKGRIPHPDLPLDIRGTAFQRRVWQELMRIPPGVTRSYSELARDLGNPDARRAVARGCATNPVPLVIPCHRVVRADGAPGGYRWGMERKRRLLEHERRQAARE